MSALQIICLANSRKNRRRCVAGIRLDGGGWLRPVSADLDSHGGLTEESIRLPDRTTPRLLDVIEIPIASPCPSIYQPENYFISPEPWMLVARPGSRTLLKSATIEYGPLLLGNQSDRIAPEAFASSPATSSLALAHPDENKVMWHVTTSYRGAWQLRARFALSSNTYDLVVTDSSWESKFHRLASGYYSSGQVGVPDDSSILLTVSMGDPWNEICFKYVAGVLVL